MIQRVFDYAEVPCTCLLDNPATGRVSVKVAKISRAKAVLTTPLIFEPGARIALTLEIEGGPSVDLSADVAASGERGLFLRWAHADATAESKLQTLLVEHSGGGSTAPRPDPPPNPAVASILDRATTIRSADLAARVANVRVLTTTTITQWIQEAVEEAVQRTTRAWNEAERARLLEEAEEVFNERLEIVKAEKAGLEVHWREVEEQLTRAQQLLEEERRKELSADQFTISDAGIVEIERRLGRLVDHAIQSRGLDGDTTHELRRVFAQLLDDEREKISQKAREAQSDSISLLERKVDRLARALDDSQQQRERAERRARVLEEGGGGAVHNQMTAGLADEDPDRDRKLTLLRELIQDNRDVREHVNSRRENQELEESSGSFVTQPAEARTEEVTDEDADFLVTEAFGQDEESFVTQILDEHPLGEDAEFLVTEMLGPEAELLATEGFGTLGASEWDFLERGEEEPPKKLPPKGGVKKIEVDKESPPPLERT